jgi:hypothetical protein
MSTYRAPLTEMHFVLTELAGLDQVASLPGFEEATPDVVAAILDEAAEVRDGGPGSAQRHRRSGRFAPPRRRHRENAGGIQGRVPHSARTAGTAHEDERVRRPGLPHLVGTAVEEMWHSSNLAFNLCPLLTQGAIEAIEPAALRLEGHLPNMVPASGPAP